MFVNESALRFHCFCSCEKEIWINKKFFMALWSDDNFEILLEEKKSWTEASIGSWSESCAVIQKDWSFLPKGTARRYHKGIDILLSMNEEREKKVEENLFEEDYHLQKNNFLINDSFCSRFFFSFFFYLHRSCAWNDNSLSFSLRIFCFCLMSFHRFRLSPHPRWIYPKQKEKFIRMLRIAQKTWAFCKRAIW